MLKNCFLPVDLKNKINARCGEIICQSEDDFTIICTYCEMKLFEFSDFLLHFRNVHLHRIKFKNNTPKELDISISDDDTEIHKNNFKAEYCDEEYLEYETSEGVKCDYSDDQDEVLFNINDNESYQSPTDDEGWQNKDLDESGETDTKLLIKRDPKDNKCTKCEKSYKTAHGLQIHFQKKHLIPKEYKCDQCSEEFLEERFLQTHIRKTHSLYSCQQCDRVYKSPYALRNHEITHKETRDFVCDYENCGKAFVSKRRLVVHKETHANIRNYVCEICGYQTRIKTALVVHKRSHTGEKPFPCQQCGKCFASSSLLIEHKAAHTTDKRFKCDICGAAFTRAKTLYHHKPLHLGVKKFVCKLCGKAYAQASGLCGHMRQHRMQSVPE